VETRRASIRTGYTYEQDKRKNHHGKSAAPDNPGSPNDNGVTYNNLKGQNALSVYGPGTSNMAYVKCLTNDLSSHLGSKTIHASPRVLVWMKDFIRDEKYIQGQVSGREPKHEVKEGAVKAAMCGYWDQHL
jgi:hypothetical protein